MLWIDGPSQCICLAKGNLAVGGGSAQNSLEFYGLYHQAFGARFSPCLFISLYEDGRLCSQELEDIPADSSSVYLWQSWSVRGMLLCQWWMLWGLEENGESHEDPEVTSLCGNIVLGVSKFLKAYNLEKGRNASCSGILSMTPCSLMNGGPTH